MVPLSLIVPFLTVRWCSVRHTLANPGKQSQPGVGAESSTGETVTGGLYSLTARKLSGEEYGNFGGGLFGGKPLHRK